MKGVRIWVHFGTGDYRRTYSIHSSYIALGESVCLALPFFHAFTGCNSTCSFYRKTKMIWFQSWIAFCHCKPGQCDWGQCKWGQLTAAFQQLSWLPSSEITHNNMAVIEEFVANVFSKQELAVDL